MTGEKDKFTTHEKRWKIDDDQLSTPKHDELVLHILDPDNAEKIFKLKEKRRSPWKFTIYSRSDSRAEDFVNDYKESVINPDADINKLKIDSEVPIRSKSNGYIIGYVDVKLSFRHKYNCYLYDYGSEGLKVYNNKNLSIRDLEENKYICYFEMATDHYKVKSDEVESYNIEVKPVIDSFGKTLRQINTYKAYEPEAKYYIYSPDTRFKAAFESQGVGFITPQDLGIEL
jgi:hypothetical protein